VSGVRVISGPLCAVPCSVARSFISRGVVLRSVSMALEAVAVAHQRRQAGQHLQVLRDADAWPAGAEALAAAIGHGHDAEAVSESFSGTSTSASPLASSATCGCHSSKVSNSSRVGARARRRRPRPPPCGRSGGGR
jgi:hypothetical protein